MATHARDPWYRITPERHLNDARLRRLCCAETRALYYEGRHVMHCYGEPYGHLALQPGVPMTVEHVVEFLVMKAAAVERGLEELFKAGLWKKTAEGVFHDPELISIWDAVQQGRKTGATGGNPRLTKGRVNPPVKAPVKGGVNPPVNPTVKGGVNHSLTLSLSSSSPSPEEREREREGGPTEAGFLAAFAGEDIDAGYLRDKWAWFEGNNAWLDEQGAPKNFRVIVRAWWRKDAEKWNADHGPGQGIETRAEIEAELKKLPAGHPDRAPLLAKLNAA